MHIQKLVLLIGLNRWIDVFCVKDVLLTEILNISEIIKRLNGIVLYLHTQMCPHQITNWHSIHTIDYHAANGLLYKFFKIKKLPLENVFHFLDQFMFQNSNYKFMFINLVWINLTSKKLALKGPPNTLWWGIQSTKVVFKSIPLYTLSLFLEPISEWMFFSKAFGTIPVVACIPDHITPIQIRGKRFSSQGKFWLSVFFQFSISTQRTLVIE